MGETPPLVNRRYRLAHLLGSGGFGEVFAATDERTGDQLALKRLTRINPHALRSFKREFRLLADCAHPHLVKYHELVHDQEQWWLVMDYIAGTDLRTYVRVDLDDSGSTRTQLLPMASGTPDAGATAIQVRPLTIPQVERVRRLLPQLGEALRYLHGRGIVHRDLKPANIRIDPSERLVLLDFGLAWDDHAVGSHEVVGTMRYMAPEQALGEALPASDWYSVGVILYTLLTGEAPFVGDVSQQLAQKRRGPPLPAMAAEHLPQDLWALTLALLAPEPAQRLQLAGILPSARPPRRPAGNGCIGRTAERQVLRDALALVRASSQGVLTLVHGPSGMGKSTLVQEFLTEVRQEPGALVLASRCYQREALPFKALDGLIDALSEHLAALPPSVVARLMPRYALHLAHIFPVLAGLPGVARPGVEPTALEPHEARRRALLALRELLVRLGESRPVVLVIDDLQWGDEESLQALGAVLGAPDPPPALAIACCRSGPEDPGQLARLERSLAAGRIPLTTLGLGPLAAPDAALLAEAQAHEASDPPSAEALAQAQRVAAGHPLLLVELVRAIGEVAAAPSVAALMTMRLSRLPVGARRLAECLAVADRPRTLELLTRCADLATGLHEALAWLRAERLILARARADQEEIQLVHDQVADSALAAMGPETERQWHARWARCLEELAEPAVEAEALYRHHRAAGDTTRARAWALVAATRASRALAFAHAAELYQAAMALGGGGAELALALADSLAGAGRGREAAEAYARAATLLPPAEARHALTRAAGQYLRSGHMDAGLAAARSALAAVGERWHRGPWSALASLLWSRLMRPRGWSAGGRALEQAPPGADGSGPTTPARAERMDALWEIAHGLGGVDTIRAAALHARHLGLALASGDPVRITQGLAWEAILSFALGGQGQIRRAWRLVSGSAGVSVRCQRAHVRAWSQAAAGYGHWCEGRLDQAVTACAEAVDSYREEGRDCAWELGSVIAWCWAPALAARGDLQELASLADAATSECEAIGDLYTLTTLRTVSLPLLQLAQGEPSRARTTADEAIARWGRNHWHLQHLFAAFARCRVALYEGDAAGALAELDSLERPMRKTFQHLLQIKRIFAWHLRACALAQLGTPQAVTGLAHLERQLRAERLAWSIAHADACRGARLALSRQTAASAAAYEAAAARYGDCRMRLHEDAARALAAGARQEAAALAPALADLVGRGVRQPTALAPVLVPCTIAAVRAWPA